MRKNCFVFFNKVCIINVMGECDKQQDRENMEERKREGKSRGQNGGVIEEAGRERERERNERERERERTDDCME